MRRLLVVLVMTGVAAVAAPVLASGAGEERLGTADPALSTARVTCASGGQGTAVVNRSRDVALGPLVLIGARLTPRHRREAFNGHGYKVPLTLPDGMSATLSVPRSSRSRVGLVFTHQAQDRAWIHGVSGADRAVRFTACAAQAPRGRTGWAGGFVVDRPRCVTLVVKVPGKKPVRRRVPLGHPCRAARTD